MPIESVEYPIDFGNLYRNSGSRAGGILCDLSSEMRLPHAAAQGQPRSCLKFIFNPKFFQASIHDFTIREIWLASIIEQSGYTPDQFIELL